MLDRELDLNSCVSLGLTMALTWSSGMEPGLEIRIRSGTGAGTGAVAGLTTRPASGVASSQNWNLGG